MQSDWQNDAAYKYTKKLDWAGWAWEFLRRNPEYKADWAEFIKKKAELEKVYGKIASWKTKALEAEPKAWHYDPPKMPGESDAVWKMRCIGEGFEPVRSSIVIGPAKKWGLRQFYDPDIATDGEFRFLPGVQVRIWYHVSDVEAPIIPAKRGEFAYVEIDLSKRIAEQLSQANKQMAVLQQKLVQADALKVGRNLTKAQTKKFVTYLRILDAYASASKPPVKAIAKSLFPKKSNESGAYDGNKAVHEVHKQARQWRDHGYRRLI